MEVELKEIQDSFFTQWVSEDKRETQRTYMHSIRYKDETLGGAVQRWLEKSSGSETKRVKAMIRQGVRPKYRATLWRLVSGGAEKLQNNPNYLQDTLADIGIHIPSALSTSMFTGTDKLPTLYYLDQLGERTVLRVVYILTQIHPDIQFCPILPSLAALFLHFMGEGDCYACLTSLLDSRRSLLDQSQRAVSVMAKTFQDCLKHFMKQAYRHLKQFIEESTDITVAKGTVMFPYWVQWIFEFLDFWTLVSMVDSFLVQGPKVLVRFGLVIFNQFSKWLQAKQVIKGDLESHFCEFMKECPLKGQKLIEAAFKIRGLSRNRLTKLKNRNLVLLDSGILEIPFKREMPLKELAVMAVQGTDILTVQQCEQLSSWLPNRIRIKKPTCVFSSEEHGFSLKTFYRKCEGEEETVLLIKTDAGDLIGAFCSSPWSERLLSHKSLTFFGTGESFVFTLVPQFSKYIWSGLQDGCHDSRDYFMTGNDKCLMIGAGGENAIWLDGDLMHGRSGRSQTFNNKPLTSKEDFICTRVEVLGFIS